VHPAENNSSPQERMYFSRNPLIEWFHRLRLKIVSFLLGNTDGHMLDVGCGNGYFLRLVKTGYKVGLDASKVRLRQSRRIARNAEFILGDAHCLPFKDMVFDKISCCDVLEHLSIPDSCIAEMVRVSKVGGDIVTATPNEKILTLARLFLLKRPIGKDAHKHNLSPFRIQKMFGFGPVSSQRLPFNKFPLVLWEAEKYRKR
jgi:ubiquinone/menaquinone biosynthesis C-methylase UbiE